MTEIKREDGYWSLYVNGVRMIDRESFAVVDRVRERVDNPALEDNSEDTGWTTDEIRAAKEHAGG